MNSFAAMLTSAFTDLIEKGLIGPLFLHHLNVNVDARRKREIRERLDDLGGRLENIDEALMNAHLELLGY